MSFLSSIFGNKSEASDKIVILDKKEYATAISGSKVQLVDVRTANEFSGGHIKGAKNIDFFNSANFEKSFQKLDKNKPIYVYCRSGARSQKAARKLLNMGFTQIFDLKGGYSRWS
ncbi:rhodanese-like domain-containing protein [Zobellia uliginosa]|uniref:rhodanese-like domain-containing protein n=1 Tax=Zobellia uliginosa TaxID=143224 RepID=UPI001C066DCA|nr:rhodanese-like domain-containing protein [Zobellia uliginosa]MBU2945362.1 rhodanese-like domain-containing protein [Zobellia uliginosa]